MVIIEENSSVKYGLYMHYKGDTYLCYDSEIDANFDDGRLRAVYKKVTVQYIHDMTIIDLVGDQTFSRSAEDFNATVNGKPRFKLLSICEKPASGIDFSSIKFLGLPKMEVIIDEKLEDDEWFIISACPSCNGDDFFKTNDTFKCLECNYSFEAK